MFLIAFEYFYPAEIGQWLSTSPQHHFVALLAWTDRWWIIDFPAAAVRFSRSCHPFFLRCHLRVFALLFLLLCLFAVAVVVVVERRRR